MIFLFFYLHFSLSFFHSLLSFSVIHRFYCFDYWELLLFFLFCLFLDLLDFFDPFGFMRFVDFFCSFWQWPLVIFHCVTSAIDCKVHNSYPCTSMHNTKLHQCTITWSNWSELNFKICITVEWYKEFRCTGYI